MDKFIAFSLVDWPIGQISGEIWIGTGKKCTQNVQKWLKMTKMVNKESKMHMR